MESIKDRIRIKKLIKQGHSHHCAYRQVWGDGECECRRRKNGKSNRAIRLPKTGESD